MFLNTLKAGTRSILVAALVGSMAIAAAAPVQAQGFSFNFGINGGGSSFSYGIGKGGKKFKRDCLRNREIRDGLEDAGFYDVEIVGRDGVRVRVVATWEDDDRDYSMRVNACTGKVSDIRRVRGGGGGGNHNGNHNNNNNNNGVTLQFGY